MVTNQIFAHHFNQVFEINNIIQAEDVIDTGYLAEMILMIRFYLGHGLFQESEWVIKWYSRRRWESLRPQWLPWSLLDHGNGFVMGIVEMDWAIPSISCHIVRQRNTIINSLFPSITPEPVRGLMTVILIFTWGILDTLMCHLTVSRASCAHVVTNTDKMTSDTMRSNIPMSSVFVVVWGKMPRSKDCTGFQNYYYKQIWSFRFR